MLTSQCYGRGHVVSVGVEGGCMGELDMRWAGGGYAGWLGRQCLGGREE